MLLERVRGIFKASRKVAVHIDVVSGYLVIRIKVLTASPQPILWRSIPLTHETFIAVAPHSFLLEGME